MNKQREQSGELPRDFCLLILSSLWNNVAILNLSNVSSNQGPSTQRTWLRWMSDRQLCPMHGWKKLGNVGNIYVQSVLNAFLV